VSPVPHGIGGDFYGQKTAKKKTVDFRELVGMFLLVIGSIVVGHLLYPIIIGGPKMLTPMEAMAFSDGVSAIVIGTWLLLVKKKPS